MIVVVTITAWQDPDANSHGDCKFRKRIEQSLGGTCGVKSRRDPTRLSISVTRPLSMRAVPESSRTNARLGMHGPAFAAQAANRK